MPAGGTWTAQNKRRPGAYINFVSVPSALTVLGTRGTVAIGMPMTWGAENELITLTGSDLSNGNSLAKVGVLSTDTAASLPFRIALAGSYTALLFRTDTGATKATATIVEDKITVAAKYSGTVGNAITIVIVKDKPAVGTNEVQVLLNNILQEYFTIQSNADFETIDSDYVEFTVTDTSGEMPETAGIPLTGATNGTNTTTGITRFFALLNNKDFQCLAINSIDPSLPDLITAQVRIWREGRGKKVQAVVYDSPAQDYEGIISVDQGFRTELETVGTDLFPVWVASMTAGANVNESLTARAVTNAVEILNPVVEDEIADALANGRFILSYRQDGVVCVEQDINSLHTFTPDKNYAFSKNRVIRTLDEIGNTAALVFNRNYCGKVDNDENGRNLYKTELISLMDQLTDIGAVTNFAGASDITIMQGASVDSVVVDVTVQPVDSMEKLYMTVNVNA